MAGNTVRKDLQDLPIRLVDTKTVREHDDERLSRPDPGPVSVRKLEPAYLDEILAIERRSFPAPWSRELLLRTLEQRVAFNVGLFLKDGATERLIGYSYNYIVVDELHVLNIAISPDYKGFGYGRTLLCSVLREAIERGVVYAMLEVRVTNFVAQSLYASLGFRVGGMRRRYYRDNGEDALILERNLSREDLSRF